MYVQTFGTGPGPD